MSKSLIAETIQAELEITGVAANRAAGAVLAALARTLKKEGKGAIVGFGTLRVAKARAGTALNPRTGQKVKVKAGKTVRFKASPSLKAAV